MIRILLFVFGALLFGFLVILLIACGVYVGLRAFYNYDELEEDDFEESSDEN